MATKSLRSRGGRPHHRLLEEDSGVGIYAPDAESYFTFSDLFDPAQGRSALVVSFLALLELVRERLVDIVQNEPFAPIHAQLALAHDPAAR